MLTNIFYHTRIVYSPHNNHVFISQRGQSDRDLITALITDSGFKGQSGGWCIDCSSLPVYNLSSHKSERSPLPALPRPGKITEVQGVHLPQEAAPKTWASTSCLSALAFHNSERLLAHAEPSWQHFLGGALVQLHLYGTRELNLTHKRSTPCRARTNCFPHIHLVFMQDCSVPTASYWDRIPPDTNNCSCWLYADIVQSSKL